ncbi:MAG TPA: DegQ family serine endoprotease, partial [Planctomycetaceae bacterium]
MARDLWREVRASGIALFAAAMLGAAALAGAQAAPQAPPKTFEAPASFADLAEATLPAVVNIATTQRAETAASGPPFPGLPRLPPGSPFEDFFRDFFDRFPQGPRPQPPMRDVTALGSGFIVDPDGYVVTNNHLVANAEEVTVTLQDGTELPAKIVGRDPRTDLALLKVEADAPLPYVEWGDSDAVRVGDWVMAVGNPFRLGGTVTTGIISATARDINAGPYDDFLQTDASINHGNSGGPLFGMSGKVVGVNTAIVSPSGGNVGIGFAVPSALAKPVIEELRETGTVRRGWLGVRIQTVTDDIADAVGLEEARGALVVDVVEDSPAAAAGLEAGDVILSFGGAAIADPDALSRIVADTNAGDTVEIGILRGGDRQTVEAKIALLEQPELAAAERGEADALGLSLAELSPELREAYGIPAGTEGAVVVGVERGSPAADANLAPGDVITKVGRTAVSEPGEVVAAIEQAREADRDSVLLLRERDGNPAFVALPTE